MSPYEAGSRIAAVRDANDSTVFLYGRGVYAGDFPRPGSGNWAADQRRIAENVVRGSLEHADETRAADDAFMVKRLAETVDAGTKTQQDADQALSEYREIRAAREAKRSAMTVEEQVVELLHGMDLNPRLDLDGGGTVWGCECWWMPEEEFDSFVGSRAVEVVPLPDRSAA